MTKDDSYHKRRGNGFVYSDERELYKTDELRYALEDLQNLHEKIWEIRHGELKSTKKLELLDNAADYAYGFLKTGIDVIVRFSDDFSEESFNAGSQKDISMDEKIWKDYGGKNFEEGSQKGQEFTRAILSYNASDQSKKEICYLVRKLIWSIHINATRTIDGSRL
tara:strand:- start:6431 stop:6925 length:495 start_codon:yes stop_codon:yes gene_type:complete